jgi:uncharacterized protein involved in tellurium resistance
MARIIRTPLTLARANESGITVEMSWKANHPKAGLMGILERRADGTDTGVWVVYNDGEESYIAEIGDLVIVSIK